MQNYYTTNRGRYRTMRLLTKKHTVDNSLTHILIILPSISNENPLTMFLIITIRPYDINLK
jgi:hypothetical protein